VSTHTERLVGTEQSQARKWAGSVWALSHTHSAVLPGHKKDFGTRLETANRIGIQSELESVQMGITLCDACLLLVPLRVACFGGFATTNI
jgi:hypothetical protein